MVCFVSIMRSILVEREKCFVNIARLLRTAVSVDTRAEDIKAANLDASKSTSAENAELKAQLEIRGMKGGGGVGEHNA